MTSLATFTKSKSLQSMTKDLFKYKNLSLTIISDIESLLVLSQAERPLLVFPV